MKRFVVVAVIAVLALGLVPSVAADEALPRLKLFDAVWAQECDTGFGVVDAQGDIYIPAGWSVKISGSGSWMPLSVQQVVVPTSLSFSGPMLMMPVPGDGWTQMAWALVAPTGQTVAEGILYGNCVTGELWVKSGDIYGPKPPDPDKRVMGHVQYDTPVYGMADPATALDAVLTAGQTWFVVAEVTGVDGAQWYEVFVSGFTNGYVPAAAMVLEGPLP
ncbi:MAG: hypothetical protein OZ934_11190 [Anaerolineae bacterium]|nr:hypothetical protein [Anaerolineae bacterium]